MHMRRWGTGMMLVLAALLLLAVLRAGVGQTHPSGQPTDINSFFHGLIGEWVGTFKQSTDNKQAPDKYFHAVVKATGPNAYETVFEYYRIDPKTKKPVQAGTSRMQTSIAANGTATNTITGTGDVLIDSSTTSPEKHQFTETLRMPSAGVMHGQGTGTINVSKTPAGVTKNGKVTSYASTWTMNAGSFRIVQQIKVKFKVLLFFSKTFDIHTDFTGSRGSNILVLIKTAELNAGHAGTTTGH